MAASTSNSCFRDLLHEKLSAFKEVGDTFNGYIDTEQSYNELMYAIRALGHSYAVRNGQVTGVKKDGVGSILFQLNLSGGPSVEFFGSPFTVVKTILLQCSQGPKYYKKSSEKHSYHLIDHVHSKKKRLRIMDTKKLGCPVSMRVRCIRFYPDINVDASSKWKSRNAVKTKLKEAILSAESPPPSMLRYYIEATGTHSHSKDAAHLTQEIHPDLIKEIYRLVEAGFTSVRDLSLLLEQFVEKSFEGKEKPSKLHAAFHPSHSKIYAHMHAASFKLKKTVIDQEALALQIKKWNIDAPNDQFMFRPYEEDDSDNVHNSILFCHQTQWQAQLLKRYGKVCLLDATYKTTKYALPLFFLTVKTNSGYSVVGTFLVQTESAALISEALNVFRSWNPDWQPDFFMTDYSEAEINAIEAVFSDCRVYLCAFHREQAWLRWLNKSGNVAVPDSRSDILQMWRKVARSATVDEYEANYQVLTASSTWKENTKAANYFQTQWMPEVRRWVDCFHQTDYVTCISTNNGVESQNKLLKHNYLCFESDKTLTGILKVVINKYLPDCFKKYCLKNSHVKNYNASIPVFLQNRPFAFIKHVMSRVSSSQTDIHLPAITDLTDGMFAVRSSTDDNYNYIVDFAEGSCTCADYLRWRFPCKHMCGIFNHIPGWGFNQLSASYRENPYITLDTSCAYGMIDSSLLGCEETVAETEGLTACSSETATTVNEDEAMVTEDDSEPPINLKTLQQRVREESKKTANLSYLLTDELCLKQTIIQMEAMNKMMESKLQTSGGLPVDTSSVPNVVSSKSKYKELPSRKRKAKGNWKSAGRVGTKASMWRTATKGPVIPDPTLISAENDDIEIEGVF